MKPKPPPEVAHHQHLRIAQGHQGMVGSAIVRRLSREDCEVVAVNHSELDLSRQTEVEDWIEENRPQAIFIAAAKVGGISANITQPTDSI